MTESAHLLGQSRQRQYIGAGRSSIQRAAFHARAVFEGAGLIDPPGLVDRRRFPHITWLAPRAMGQLTLYQAAHLTVVVLVILVVFTSSHLAPQAGLLYSQSIQASSMPPVVADLLIERVAPIMEPPDIVAVSAPALMRPQAQMDVIFAQSHIVAEGETLGEIADRYNISISSLFWSNNLDNSSMFMVGEELRIPRISGVPHQIQAGDTLTGIAEQYGVSEQVIMLLQPNGIRSGIGLLVDHEIFIPGGTRSYTPALLDRYGSEAGLAGLEAGVAGVVRESETNLRTGPGRSYDRIAGLDAGQRLRPLARYEDWIKVDAGSAGEGWIRADLLNLPESALSVLPVTSNFPPPPPRWVWPTWGEITSPFGWRSVPYRSFHDGLDIANKSGTLISAARAGRVIEAGWCSGFGYCVKIDHGGGVVSIYGHLLKKPRVRAGDMVDLSDPIGLMGSTYDARGGGYSSGVHLHFMIKVNGKAINPLRFLP